MNKENLVSLMKKFLSLTRKNGPSTALKQGRRYLYGSFNTSKVSNRYETSSLPCSNFPLKIFNRRPRGYQPAKGKFIKEIYLLRPWYHDFEDVGIQTNFPAEKKWIFFGQTIDNIRHLVKQQPRKESVIKPYIKRALRGCSGKTVPSILDIFCSDGYYCLWAKNCCKTSEILGVDINRYDVHRAQVMAKILGFENTKFVNHDVINYVDNCNRQFDIVINAGGLYHLTDPVKLLKSLRNVMGGGVYDCTVSDNSRT
jgi:hypothetical protein